jgi:hypothetical protein
LLLETLCASFVVDSRVDGMFDASFLFGLLAVIPTFERADKVAGDAAEAFELRAEVLGVIVIVFLGGSFIALHEELGAELNETTHVKVFVVIESLETSRDILGVNLSIAIKRFLETV